MGISVDMGGGSNGLADMLALQKLLTDPAYQERMEELHAAEADLVSAREKLVGAEDVVRLREAVAAASEDAGRTLATAREEAQKIVSEARALAAKVTELADKDRALGASELADARKRAAEMKSAAAADAKRSVAEIAKGRGALAGDQELLAIAQAGVAEQRAQATAAMQAAGVLAAKANSDIEKIRALVAELG